MASLKVSEYELKYSKQQKNDKQDINIKKLKTLINNLEMYLCVDHSMGFTLEFSVELLKELVQFSKQAIYDTKHEVHNIQEDNMNKSKEQLQLQLELNAITIDIMTNYRKIEKVCEESRISDTKVIELNNVMKYLLQKLIDYIISYADRDISRDTIDKIRDTLNTILSDYRTTLEKLNTTYQLHDPYGYGLQMTPSFFNRYQQPQKSYVCAQAISSNFNQNTFENVGKYNNYNQKILKSDLENIIALLKRIIDNLEYNQDIDGDLEKYPNIRGRNDKK